MLTVFGSINLDHIIQVPVLPLSGETVVGKSSGFVPGGKGANQAVAAARIASGRFPVCMVGAIGSDAEGSIVLENLRSNGVELKCQESRESATGTAIVTIDAAAANMITVLPGANECVKASMFPLELQNVTEVFLCQGEVDITETFNAITKLKQFRHSARVILNLAPVPSEITESMLLQAVRLVDILIVNEHECVTVEQVLDRKMEVLTSQHSIQIIVTRGAEGADVFLKRGQRERVPGHWITPVDTTGAGDTFCGVLAACVYEGRETKDAVRIACEAAALSCGSKGAQTGMPHREQLSAFAGRSLEKA